MRVVDGDTIRVALSGELRTVRLIGVDTPETKHPTKAVQRGGKEASAFTQAMLDRKTVELVTDPEGDQVDRYDRLLRYVYLDGKNFKAFRLAKVFRTTPLYVELLPDDERIVAIEDTLELRIEHSNCVRFEARGLSTGAVTIRDLVRQALRHRPDHIVIGEVRGGEAADLLQALNTGHGGSLTTVHANNAESALSRLASCAMQGGGQLPGRTARANQLDHLAPVLRRVG